MRKGFFILAKKNKKLREVANGEQVIEQFIYWKQAQGLSPTTISDYRNHVKRFFKRFPDAFENQDKLKNSLLKYMSQPVKPATYNLRLTYLRVFF